MVMALGLIFVGVVLIGVAVRSARIHIVLRIGLGLIGIVLIGLPLVPLLDVWFGYTQLNQ